MFTFEECVVQYELALGYEVKLIAYWKRTQATTSGMCI